MHPLWSEVWSYERLARACHFKGYEALIVDAEGLGARTLHSVTDRCRSKREAWPGLFQFENVVRCDKFDGHGT